MNTGEYDMYEFDLGNTFNYAELSWLICPDHLWLSVDIMMELPR